MLASSAIGLLAACAPARVQVPTPEMGTVRTTLSAMPTRNRLAVAPVKSTMFLESPFAREQLRFTRVRRAHEASRSQIEQLFDRKGIPYPAAEVYLRVFKQNRVLEMWVRSPNQDRFQLLKTYRICALAGKPGPKRRQGDAQVPEGFYNIDLFNPVSSYHLSLRIDYPNRYDREANPNVSNLGGDIFIHGGCKSDGCLAMTDEGINELYLLAVMARSVGQQQIPVHIYPARLDAPEWKRVEKAYARDKALITFWNSLKPGYEYFEREHRVPRVAVTEPGRYTLLD